MSKNGIEARLAALEARVAALEGELAKRPTLDDLEAARNEARCQEMLLQASLAALETRVAQLEAELAIPPTLDQLRAVVSPQTVIADECPGPGWELSIGFSVWGDETARIKVWKKVA